jgi:hypothetical protein
LVLEPMNSFSSILRKLIWFSFEILKWHIFLDLVRILW